MTTGPGNREKNGRDADLRSRMVSIYSYGAGILIIIFMANLSPLIDAVIHPDIDYFNEEHLIVGGVTTLVTSVLFLIVMNFFSRLRKKENELQRLNAELGEKVAERTRQLVESQEKLIQEEKLALFGMIAAGMGNELRNPLGVMNNAVFFLQSIQPDATETVKEYLEIIRQEIDNSKRIISEMLDYYRTALPRSAEVPVDALIGESLTSCSIPENVRLRIETAETPFAVNVDPKQMGQVLRNLVTNAVQVMPAGGTLSIGARRVRGSEKIVEYGPLNIESDGDWVAISVTDTGTGIAPENMAKLFQPLFTTKSRGIGLGLAISRKLVEANGGRIEVESELGKGTTFTLMLPVERSKI